MAGGKEMTKIKKERKMNLLVEKHCGKSINPYHFLGPCPQYSLPVSKVKSLLTSQKAHQAGAYLRFQ